MTQPKNTPGPWRIEAVSDAVRIVVGAGRRKIILARLCPKQIPETETLANATLMVSALDLVRQRDELLAALEAVVKMCPSFPGEVEIAIRKARGRQ